MTPFKRRCCAVLLLAAMTAWTPTVALADGINETAMASSTEPRDGHTAPVEPVSPSPEQPPTAPEAPPIAPETPPAAPVAPTAPPALLPDHVKYMAGYPNGTMQPDKRLTRAEAVSLIYRLMAANPEAGTGHWQFSDVSDGDWYAQTINALARLGMLEAETVFRPNDAITRAEFVSILVHLAADVSGDAHFSDVPADHWAAASIGKAVALGWIGGYPNGTFGPERTLTRAEACAILNRITGRNGDAALSHLLLSLGLYKDVPPSHWAGNTICEATVPHNGNGAMTSEAWGTIDYDSLHLAPGVHDVQGVLYAVDRNGHLLRNQAVGAYIADDSGRLTATNGTYQSTVPYISMLDGLGATVGCEPISALMGLHAKGIATNVSPRHFLAAMPASPSNPEFGFVGSPYHHDGRYSSINPRPLAAYCNTYCPDACENISGASVEQIRQELLCGNLIVAYQTYWWQPIRNGQFLIDGRWQTMVANNHVRLITGYDPIKGYYVSDPYNPNTPGQAYQYWIDAQTFDKLWNQRKMGMVIR